MSDSNERDTRSDTELSIQEYRERTQPIFILGSVRSGTSALGNALREGAGIEGALEGHSSTLMGSRCQTLDRVTGNFPPESNYLINSLDADDLRSHITDYFLAFYARQCPAGMWADKSPDDFEGAPSIRSAPTLLSMFPNARFIYCKRRGIENVLSRLAKFPQVPFWYHCQSWAGTIVAWHEVREVLGDRWMEVTQEDMALEPGRVADDLGTFLALSETQVSGIQETLSGRRPEQTRPAQEVRQLGLDETGWSQDNQANFIQTCGHAMELAGYRLAGSGQSEDQKVIRLFHISKSANPGTPSINVEPNRHRFLSEAEFALAPLPDGERAEATYPQIELRAGALFRAVVSLISAVKQDVWFGVEVRDSLGSCVAETSHRLTSGEVKSLDLAMPDLEEGLFTVTLWTRTDVGVTVGPVDAIWNSPTFFLPTA